MAKGFFDKIMDSFKSKEQRELEARMEFKKNKREFQKYYNDLDGSIKAFSKMALNAEQSGNHANALAAAKFVKKLQTTQTNVQGLLQRFEMMETMRKYAGVMSTFVETCANMGVNMNANINLKDMWKNSAAMETALSKLDAMSDQMDMVFDAIDQGLPSAESDASSAEAEDLLNSIIGRDTLVNNPPAATPVAMEAQPAVAQPAQPALQLEGGGTAAAPAAPATEADEMSERLRKMMEELKS